MVLMGCLWLGARWPGWASMGCRRGWSGGIAGAAPKLNPDYAAAVRFRPARCDVLTSGHYRGSKGQNDGLTSAQQAIFRGSSCCSGTRQI